ncbi:hypothetical protein INT47_005036, partial [Mucor saturninus]
MSFVRSRKISEKTDDPFIKESVMKGVAYKETPSWISSMHDQIRLTVLTSLGLYLRSMKLGYPAYVTDLEIEITKQVNWYMAGKFFIGKFPPLVGIICSGLSRIVGYYGTESLNYAGQPFVEFPLVALRRFSALLGASLIPIMYMTIRGLGHSRAAATLAAGLLIFENGLITQSRYATPEVYVLFFSAMATLSWTYMHKNQSQVIQSTIWQLITGASLGCAVSCKWTGMLALPMIWVSIAFETYNKLCDKRNTVKSVIKQNAIYLLTVGLLPLVIYGLIFSFHLALIPSAGDHDLLLSSHLKYSLVGNVLEPSQPNIAYGSQIVIKHAGTAGGYLHSHQKRFSGGSTQQEVTLYPHVDLGNVWTVHKANQIWNASLPIEFVNNKDSIRLEHYPSTRKLHSHDHRPQLSARKEHNEVTAYGDRYIQDSHDFWTLNILTDENRPSKDTTLTWKSLNQRFRLVHARGCVLISHHAYYGPPTGENHQEVTCMASAGTHISPWIVESSYHDQLDKMVPISYEKMSTWGMIKELHQLMKTYPDVVYDRLSAGATVEGATNPRSNMDDNPNKWFLKRATLRLWNELAGYSSHLVINPIVQRVILMSMATCIGFLGLNAFLVQRQLKLPYYLSWLYPAGLHVVSNEFYTRSILVFYSAVLIQFTGLRFTPSFDLSMSDILSSMYFGTGLIATMLESGTLRLPALYRRILFYGLIGLSVVKFSHLSHLAYGGKTWYRHECEASGLDIDCLAFPPHPQELANMLENSGITKDSTQMTIYIGLAGMSQPFRYNQGQEVEADQHIAILKKASFHQEANVAKGPLRYHRVLPTPGITPEEAALWAQDVTEKGMERVLAQDLQEVQALAAAAVAHEEKKKIEAQIGQTGTIRFLDQKNQLPILQPAAP